MSNPYSPVPELNLLKELQKEFAARFANWGGGFVDDESFAEHFMWEISRLHSETDDERWTSSVAR